MRGGVLVPELSLARGWNDVCSRWAYVGSSDG